MANNVIGGAFTTGAYLDFVSKLSVRAAGTLQITGSQLYGELDLNTGR